MKFHEVKEGVGRIVKGVNTTPDVGPDEISKQAKKFGNSVDKDGRPPTLSKKVKGSKTNVLYNLGLSERFTPMELALMEGGHSIEDYYMSEDKEIAQPSEIFVDMDGVLADFFGSWKKLIGKDWREIGDIDSALQKIRDTDDFWLKIPPTKNANNLLSIIKQIKGSYNILSAPLPNDPNSEPHKREWIKKYLKSFPPSKVIITHDKAKYATQADGTPNILIDDYGVNIGKWESAGGVGFKHKDHKFERTARNLAAHLKQPAKENYTREELPQLSKEDLKHIYHTVETIKVADIKPIQKERIKENFTKQLNRVQKGKYNPIIVDCENKIINGHHRYDIIKMLEMEEITVYKLPLYVENLVEFNKLTKKIGAGALAGMMALAPMGKAFAGDAPTDPLPNKQTSTMVQKDVAGKKDLSKISVDQVKSQIEIKLADGKTVPVSMDDIQDAGGLDNFIKDSKAKIAKIYAGNGQDVPDWSMYFKGKKVKDVKYDQKDIGNKKGTIFKAHKQNLENKAKWEKAGKPLNKKILNSYIKAATKMKGKYSSLRSTLRSWGQTLNAGDNSPYRGEIPDYKNYEYVNQALDAIGYGK